MRRSGASLPYSPNTAYVKTNSPGQQPDYAGDRSVERGIEEGWIEAPRRIGLEPAVRRRSSRSVLDVLDEDRG